MLPDRSILVKVRKFKWDIFNDSHLNLDFLKLCDLYGCPISDWISTCVEIGGTPEPSWEGCVQQQDGCQAYKGAICQLDSNYMINQFQLLVSATECQVFIPFLY